MRSEAAGEKIGEAVSQESARRAARALPSLTLRADDSCCKPGRALLTAHSFVMGTLAQRRLAPRALHAAQRHLCHVAAVPVPGFLGFRGSHDRKQ